LQSALADLPRTITVTHKRVDVADVFAGIGGLLVAAAIGLSLWWNRVRRLPNAAPSHAGLLSPGEVSRSPTKRV
jgi:Ca-activated chloride channel family protein